MVPSQCGIKGERTIGVLDIRNILVRLEYLEDYVNLQSVASYYLKDKEMYWKIKKLKRDQLFELDVETTIGVAWISMLDLSPIFFSKEEFFSNALAVGKPLIVDIEPSNNTRCSCVNINVEVDLIAKLPQRVRIN